MTTQTKELGAGAAVGPTGAGATVTRVLTTVVARGLFAVPFAVFGALHFVGANAMAAMVPVPGVVFWVYFTGLALIAGAAGIVTGRLGKWAAFGLAALMLVFVLTVHLPGLGNPQTGQLSMISLLKDLALAGGALTWAGIFDRAREGRR